jgi:hypothetical protein
MDVFGVRDQLVADYSLDRADAEYGLGAFPIANRTDPDLAPRIPREYDAMQQAKDTGDFYESSLDPRPGQSSRHASAN